MDSIAIIERDNNGDVLLVWSYPFVEASFESILISKSRLEEDSVTDGFWFSKFKDSWIYAYNFTSVQSSSLPKVTAVSLIVMAKSFNPEKFSTGTQLLGKRYIASGSPPKVLQAYLAIFAADQFDFGPDGKFVGGDYDERKSLVKVSLKGLITTFGVETILIYTAMILKKRVAIYSSNLEQLLDMVRVTPIFAWHRRNWSLLRPLVTSTQAELDELASSGVYVAGFLDKSVETREDLFDLFVDVDNRSIKVSSQAKNDFILGKPHKELSSLMLSNAEEDLPDQQLIKNIATQTKEFLDRINSLISEGQNGVTVDAIKSSEQSSAVARFLWNTAIAEDKAEY